MSITKREAPIPAGRTVAAVAVCVAVIAGLAPPPGPARADSVAAPLPAERGLTREILWECVVSFPGSGSLGGFTADLDGDGRHEVVLHSGRRNDPSYVAALDGSMGGELWRAAFPERSCAVAADLTGSGESRVVVACGTELSVLDGATGERLRGTTLRGTIGDIACAQVGGPAIVYTAGRKRDDVLVVLAGDDLRELWSRAAASASGPFARGFTHPSALDVDGDGRDEVVVAENGNRLLCLSGDGKLMWDVGLGRCERLNPEGVVSSLPVVADLLGDGINELAVGCFAGAVVVMDARTGEVLSRMQFGVESHQSHLENPKIPRFIREALRQTGEPVNCLAPVELDGSPGEELVLGCSDGFMYACDLGSGDVLWQFETRDNVYDPCLTVDSAGPTARTVGLLAWDAEAVYLLDGGTGSALPGLGDVAGAARMFACDLTGTTSPELVRIAPEGGRVTAWSREGGP